MDENQETKSLRVDHRHLAFFFLGAVTLCAIFFALGFVVGRAQAFETALKDQSIAKGVAETRSATEPGATVDTSKIQTKDSREKIKSEGHEVSRDSSSDYRRELDFYSAVKDQKADPNFHPESIPPEKLPTPNSRNSHQKVADAKHNLEAARPKTSSAPLISLQIAALRSSSDADKLAKTLRAKGYPVFVVNSANDSTDKLIRIQIGPYTSETEAVKVKSRLETDGYQAIVKK
jgi:cell division septation protein DedD